MRKKTFMIEVVGYGLALLYVIMLAAYLQFSNVSEPQKHVNIIVALFTILFVSSVAIEHLKSWGRALIVIVNIMTGLYLIKPFVIYEGFIPLCYLIICVAGFLFFGKYRMKTIFKPKAKGRWQSLLVIDDDQTQIKMIRPILMSYGYSVLFAETGELGLQIAETQKPDLILLDVILPGIKGREVCERLKKNDTTKDIPVVFVTVKDSSDDIKAEMEAGAHAHLTKPINVKSLISTVQRILN